jgi:2-polyprenyl-6-hydroxyphenyl methylase/3-demethylubiquinone-9 3-methyltransferase
LPLAVTAARCKCCGAAAPHAFDVDLNRSCEDANSPVFPPSGTLVAYFRCVDCGFLFTPDFDAWSGDDFAHRIYNDEYHRVDPDFAQVRPAYFARQLTQAPPSARARVRTLDYGGGEGRLTALLRASGFAMADFVDPHFGAGARPAGVYDLVTAFEVFEHATAPLASAEQAMSYVAETGVLLFSTALQPKGDLASWFYVAPRNGHVSIHTRNSLGALAARLGVRYRHLGGGLHLYHRLVIGAAPKVIIGEVLARARYDRSRAGLPRYLGSIACLVALGRYRDAAHPKHLVRAAAVSLGLVAARDD